MSEDPIDQLHASQEVDIETFEHRVREEAEIIKDHLTVGTFDNAQRTIGLEYEFYAVDRTTDTLRRIPRSDLQQLGFEQELGLHNAELTTAPQPFNAPGVEAIFREVDAKLTAFDRQVEPAGYQLVSDGMWTIGPDQRSTVDYLTEATRSKGLTLAINVSNAVRYHGFASGDRVIAGQIDLPGISLETTSTGPATLTTSIQPHYQLRRARNLPAYFDYAARVAGPLLALGVNSPFLPPELYDGADPETILTEGWDETRVPIYEGMMNPDEGPQKVRFPKEITTPEEAVQHVVEDFTIVPAQIDAGERFDDAFVHFRHKHGSYWRWVRPVFDGPTKDAANVRIEFRPIPAQPTVTDTVAYLATFAGLMVGLFEQNHPVADLPWSTAQENFYAAARSGLEAELSWITSDGHQVTDTEQLYNDLFTVARSGLQAQGFEAPVINRWIAPLEDRLDRMETPADWKRRRARQVLADGATIEEAIYDAQKQYLSQQRQTLLTGRFADWPSLR